MLAYYSRTFLIMKRRICQICGCQNRRLTIPIKSLDTSPCPSPFTIRFFTYGSPAYNTYSILFKDVEMAAKTNHIFSQLGVFAFAVLPALPIPTSGKPSLISSSAQGFQRLISRLQLRMFSPHFHLYVLHSCVNSRLRTTVFILYSSISSRIHIMADNLVDASSLVEDVGTNDVA